MREPTEREKRVTLLALIIVFLLSALDQTIVSTAMPRIVQELQGIHLYAWVTSIYLLTSTVMVPIWGKFGDIFGRKRVLITGTSIFVLGSCLCGLAGEFGKLPIVGDGMMQLIVFRGIQGIGGGALFTTAFATIADLYPPRERGRYSGLLGAVFGVASVIGPIVGGWFTDHGTLDVLGAHVDGWRWVFYVNLPTSGLALFMISVKMPALGTRRGGQIDYLGAMLIIVAIGALMLALTFGPRDGWTARNVIALFVLSSAAGLLFLKTESKVPEPTLPLSIFEVRAFSTAMVSSFMISMAFMGTIIFLPLYLQLALGIEATSSGLTMLPLMMGLIISSTIAGRLVTRTGKYRPFLFIGAAIQFTGLLLMSKLTAHSTQIDVVWRLFVLGIGLGPSQSLFSLIAQSAVPPRQIGVATSTSMFVRQIGGLVGVAIFGAILTAQLQDSLASVLPPGMKFDLGKMEAMAMMAQGTQGEALSIPPVFGAAFADAMRHIFRASLIIIACAFTSMCFIPHITLHGRKHSSPGRSESAEAEPAAAN